jgi:hypothetical protein
MLETPGMEPWNWYLKQEAVANKVAFRKATATQKKSQKRRRKNNCVRRGISEFIGFGRVGGNLPFVSKRRPVCSASCILLQPAVFLDFLPLLIDSIDSKLSPTLSF